MNDVQTPENIEEKLIDDSIQHEPLEKKYIVAGALLFLILIIAGISSLGGGPSKFRNLDQLNPSLAQPPKDETAPKTDVFGVEAPPPTTPTPKPSATPAATQAPTATPTTAPTAAPTATPAPTSSPTNTPTPTSTPTPTDTPTPTPSPTQEP